MRSGGSAPLPPPVDRKPYARPVEETRLSHLSWNEICERLAETARQLAAVDEERLIEAYEEELPVAPPAAPPERQRRPSYTSEDVRAAWEETGSPSGVAKALGCNLSTAYTRLRAEGLFPPPGEKRPEPDAVPWTDEDLRAAWAEKGTVTGTARRLGCAVQTARKHLDRLGLRNSE